jgi:tetratricopeptide (TPR) repeat protein
VSSSHGELPDFDALWNYDQPAATERAFQDVLGRTTDRASLDYRLELLTQLARAQALQRHFDEAHATLDQVQAQLLDEAVVPRIRYLLERGRTFNSSGEPGRAHHLFLEAWEVASAHAQDAYAVDAAHMLGIVEQGEQSLLWNRQALGLARRSDDPRAGRWQGSLYNNMGWSYHAAGEYEQALVMFESALAAWEADGQSDRVPIARWSVARALRSLGRTQEAFDRQMALLAESERAGTRDGYVLEEIGECLLSLGRIQEAQPYFLRAWDMLSQDAWLTRTEPTRLERLHTLGTAGAEG